MTRQRFHVLCTDSGAHWMPHELPFLEWFLKRLFDHAYWFLTFPDAAPVIERRFQIMVRQLWSEER